MSDAADVAEVVEENVVPALAGFGIVKIERALFGIKIVLHREMVLSSDNHVALTRHIIFSIISHFLYYCNSEKQIFLQFVQKSLYFTDSFSHKQNSRLARGGDNL